MIRTRARSRNRFQRGKRAAGSRIAVGSSNSAREISPLADLRRAGRRLVARESCRALRSRFEEARLNRMSVICQRVVKTWEEVPPAIVSLAASIEIVVPRERLRCAINRNQSRDPKLQTSCRPWSSYALFWRQPSCICSRSMTPPSLSRCLSLPPGSVDPTKLRVRPANTLFLGGNSRRL